jgi:hypothetical protein
MLTRPPSQTDLERLYWELAQVGAPSVGAQQPWAYAPADVEQLLALAGDMLRYDARLLSILLQWFLAHYQELDLGRLRRAMKGMRWPQALGVVLEFARSASNDVELAYAARYLVAGWPRIEPTERFFIDDDLPGSRMAQRRLGRNLRAYSAWGFIGVERPTADAATKQTVGRYDRATRLRILADALRRSPSVSLGEYLDAIDHSVIRQQALADLRSVPGLRLTGHGRGARWKLRQPSNGRAP